MVKIYEGCGIGSFFNVLASSVIKTTTAEEFLQGQTLGQLFQYRTA